MSTTDSELPESSELPDILSDVSQILDAENELQKLERYVRRVSRCLAVFGVPCHVQIDAEAGTICFAAIRREKLLDFAQRLEYRVDELGLRRGSSAITVRQMELDLRPLIDTAPTIDPHLRS